MSFPEISSRDNIATTNSTSECVNNVLSDHISQDNIANTECSDRRVVPAWLVGLEINV